MGQTPNPPSEWGLTEEEINKFAEDLVGEPAPGDNNWRPAGGSLLSGVGQCLYDEIKGIWDLIKFLWEYDQDIDMAVDGENDWDFLRSPLEGYYLETLFADLESGAQDFGVLPEPQRRALFRVYAKRETIKAVLEQVAKAGICMLAAYDVFWKADYDLLTINQSENVIKLLCDAVSLFYSDEEWTVMAQSGKALAEKITETIEKKTNEDPWGSAGYVICMIVLLISPTKVLRALKPIMAATKGLSRVTDFARVLRANNIRVPSWAGGKVDEAADAAAAANRIEETADVATDANKIDNAPDAETGSTNQNSPEARSDTDPETPKDPKEGEAADTNNDTTEVNNNDRRTDNQLKGDHAEADVVRRIEADGYEVIDISRGKNGIDITAVKLDTSTNPPTLRQTFGEVKANSSALSKDQVLGGPEYIDMQLRRARQDGSGYSGIDKLDDMLEEAEDLGYTIAKPEYVIYKYSDVTPDGISGPGKTSPWTPGTTNREFKLDANGNPIQRVDPNGNPMTHKDGTPWYQPGDRRVWTDMQ